MYYFTSHLSPLTVGRRLSSQRQAFHVDADYVKVAVTNERGTRAEDEADLHKQ
ncbi:hypothetical protein Ddye_024801 [Dipteronia dyeriana]|uniref:Uncharacterized protein n=1 Tax=Dipteronia dyeriana TaxID=168575 RepID=A0AAD9WUI8_9ROSI|nr:hypothetical protein Ddye_024801 [Dipteronia dyeriana]